MDIQDTQIEAWFEETSPPVSPELHSRHPRSSVALPSSQPPSSSPAELPSSQPSQQPRLPEIGVANIRQRQMILQYDVYGIPGLRNEIYKLVSEKHLDNKSIVSWRKMKEWMEDDYPHVEVYLQSMDPRFLRALMEGTVGYLMVTDQDFRQRAFESHKLENAPQIYLNVCSRSPIPRPSASFSHSSDETEEPISGEGCGPGIGYILSVLKCMQDYLAVEDVTSKVLAQRIDSQFVQRHGPEALMKSPYSRVYLPSEKSLKFLKGWVSKLEPIFRNFQKELHLNDRQCFSDLQWSFSEVGFGVRASSRAQMHAYHEGTNHLFGLFTACLRYFFPNEFEIKAFAIMDVWEPRHADCCETLGSLLAGSYGQDVGWGLNPVLAGGAALDGKNAIDSPANDQFWADSNRRRPIKVAWARSLEHHKQTYERTRSAIRFDATTRTAALKEIKVEEKEIEELEREIGDMEILKELREERENKLLDLLNEYNAAFVPRPPPSPEPELLREESQDIEK